MSFDFKIDPANYAGIDHESYRSDMLQLALAQPTEYTRLRKTVLDKVKRNAVNSQYAIYYYLLTEGQAVVDNKASGSILPVDEFNDAQQKMFKPKVPSQIVNEFDFLVFEMILQVELFEFQIHFFVVMKIKLNHFEVSFFVLLAL